MEVDVENLIVVRGQLVWTILAFWRIIGSHFADVLLGSAVDFVEAYVWKYLDEVVSERLVILVTNAAIDLPHNSHLSANENSLGCTAERVLFHKLGLHTA